MRLMTLLFPAAALVAALISLVPLTHALTTHELDQFPRGDGTNKTVRITDNEDGTLTFTVYRGCKRDDSDNNVPGSGDEPDTPDLLPPGDPDTGVDPARLGSPPARFDRREGEKNCTLPHTVSITVFSSPIINQQPACVPRRAIVAFSVKGFPLFNRCPGRGRGCGGQRVGRKGGRRGGNRGRSGSRGGRGKRDAMRTDEFEEVHDRTEKIVGEDELMGVAVDGFPIYSANSSDVADRLLNASDLDQCGGRCGSDGSYRYHVVPGRRLLLGCIKGQLAAPLPTPAPRPDRSQDEEEDEEDVSEEKDSEQCSFFISCSAAESAGSCDASQPVSTDNYTCIDFDENKRGGSSRDVSEEDEEEQGSVNFARERLNSSRSSAVAEDESVDEKNEGKESVDEESEEEMPRGRAGASFHRKGLRFRGLGRRN